MTGRTTAARLRVIPVPAPGAEDVVVAGTGPDEGAVFTGTEDGSIFRIARDGDRIDRVARTGGRPLGLELDPDGRLVVCDARRGLLRVDVTTGAVEVVTDRVGDQKLVFCNNAAITGSGEIWFSDSSTEYGLDQWKDDLVQNTCTGRLLRRARGRRGRGGAGRPRLRQRCRPGRRRVLRRGRRDCGPDRRPALAAAATGPAPATSCARTCRAIPTTSPAAATG